MSLTSRAQRCSRLSNVVASFTHGRFDYASPRPLSVRPTRITGPLPRFAGALARTAEGEVMYWPHYARITHSRTHVLLTRTTHA